MEDLYYLDESGFSPTLPTGYTWARIGVRAVVKREDTKNRRVNVLGALNETGPEPELLWTAVDHSIDAEMVLDFLCTQIARLPGGADRLDDPPQGWKRHRSCTIVLDNAQIHRAKLVTGRREQLAAIGVHLFYLPPRSPELNHIECVWRSIKYEDMPVRAYTSAPELHTAVDHALTRRAAAVASTTPSSSRPLSRTVKRPRVHDDCGGAVLLAGFGPFEDDEEGRNEARGFDGAYVAEDDKRDTSD